MTNERSALGYSIHFFLGMIKFGGTHLVKGLKLLFELAATGASGGDYDRKKEAKRKAREAHEREHDHEHHPNKINDDNDLRPEWAKRLDRQDR